MGANHRLSVVLAMILGLITGICSAKTITVGDKTGWTIPKKPTYYNTWATTQSFRVGDVLVFDFQANQHTVAEVTKPAYDACNTTNLLHPAVTAGPAQITLKTLGTHYFICTFPGHCSAGQKLSVTTTGSSSPSAAAPQTSPAASPTSPSTANPAGTGSATPPSKNFAASTTAGVGFFSLVAVVVAALLF